MKRVTGASPFTRFVAAVIGLSLGLILAFLVMGLLSACAQDRGADNQPATAVDPNIPAGSGKGAGEFRVNWVELGDGYRVQCITYLGYREGGVSCDWNRRVPS